MIVEKFAGDKKGGEWLLKSLEDKYIPKIVKLVPSFIETYHLTAMTLVWAVLGIMFCYLARSDLRWLWAVSLIIILQWITDMLDGAVGRHRKTGLVKWGYFADHFLDSLFTYSLLTGYTLLIPEVDMVKQLIMAIIGLHMVHTYLAFAVLNKFRIAFKGFGTSEFRWVVVTFNALVIYFGLTLLRYTFYVAVVLLGLSLIFMVYKTHKEVWAIDIENKNREGK